jgi:uroporphyrinogen decarboxylase
MSGKELVKKAFRREKVERIPWVPFVGVHGGYLNGVNATDYLKSSDAIVEGISKAIKLYNPDGIPVVFDLQIEAEVLGCKLAWDPKNPPAVTSHPLAEGVKLEDLKIPGKDEGRVATSLKATRELREKYPDVALYGLITGPFTLALHLLGTDIFMNMFEDPEKITNVMNFAAEVGKAMAEYYIEAGCDVIAVVDPMTSQIDPDSFNQFVSGPATSIFDHVRELGALSSFFVCGFAQQNIEVMCKCKPDNVSIDENIPLDYVKEVALKNGVSFGGNLKLTVVLLMGTKVDCQKHALECMDLGGDTGFILAPGCDLPMDTPQENLQAITTLVHDEYEQQVTRAIEDKESEIELIDLESRWKDDKVIIDVITLDSSSCAPCQYMVEAVKHAVSDMNGNVEWNEYKIKEKEGVQMMASLGVKNLPTICIDGNVEFISKIPPKQEIIRAIQKTIDKKNLR